jgi:hypothetical protein
LEQAGQGLLGSKTQQRHRFFIALFGTDQPKIKPVAYLQSRRRSTPPTLVNPSAFRGTLGV